MLLREINTVDCKDYGLSEITPEKFLSSCEQNGTPARVQTISAESGLSSVFWQYEEDILIEPVSGRGLLFVRSENEGRVSRYLLDQTVMINGGVQFCLIPYECRMSYRLYSVSERKVIQVSEALNGSGYYPEMSVKTLYAVRHLEKDERYCFKSEENSFWGLIYIEKGRMTLQLDEKKYDLGEKQLMILPPHQTHLRKNSGKGTLYFMDMTFDGEFFPDGTKEAVAHPVYADRQMRQLLGEIRRENDSERLFANEMMFSLLERLLIVVARTIRSDRICSEVPSYLELPSDNSYISACEDLIRKNITSRPTLSEIAGQLNISASYLSTLFKKKVGMTVSCYVRLVRLEKVKEMIRAGEYSIVQIADILGYCSPTYLSSEFKQQFHMSPKEYAAQYRSEREQFE